MSRVLALLLAVVLATACSYNLDKQPPQDAAPPGDSAAIEAGAPDLPTQPLDLTPVPEDLPGPQLDMKPKLDGPPTPFDSKPMPDGPIGPFDSQITPSDLPTQPLDFQITPNDLPPPTCIQPGSAYYDGNFPKPPWICQSNTPLMDNGDVYYYDAALGGTAARADSSGLFGISPGCGLKVTLTRQMTAGTISIRLFDYYCWHYNSVISSGYCGKSPYVGICNFSGSGTDSCTIGASSVGGKTIHSILVYRSHGSGSTARAQYLTIEAD